jgi:hypothetical protein
VPQRGAANQVRLVAVPCCRSVRPRGTKLSWFLYLSFAPGRLSENELRETWLSQETTKLLIGNLAFLLHGVRADQSASVPVGYATCC